MKIPQEVKTVIEELRKEGFEAYIVGGCVRDFLREVEPKDWDVASNALPPEIQKVMQKAGFKTFYENEFWTVGVVWPKKKISKSEIKKVPQDIIEVTTYRSEAKYTDKRHPDEIKPAKTIEEDLSRRDFTVNAMALAVGEKSQIPSPKSQTNSKSQIPNSKFILIDPFGGQKDLKNKIIRAVGRAEDRFLEDALRMMRAVRFATTLVGGWKIEPKTSQAIEKNSFWIRAISKERIRDEFLKIMMAERAAEGVELLRKLKLLRFIIPELEEGYQVSQNKHHVYDCYEHSLRSLDYAAKKGYNKHVRIAALLHDIGKPRTKEGEGPDATFYGHEIVGAKIAAQILHRLRFSRKDIEKIVKLVRYHLFYYNVDEVSEASVRRLIRKVGPENMEELLQVRYSDRIGSGCPKAEPYKLRHLRYVIEKASQDPISVGRLKVSGNEVMKSLKISPGPTVGQILSVLLGEVLEDPKKNKKEYLLKRIRDLGKLKEKELRDLAKRAEAKREKIETKRDEMTKKKYWVT